MGHCILGNRRSSIAALLTGLALVSSAYGQAPRSAPTLLDRFDQLSPAARWRLVASTKGTDEFTPASRGDLVQSVIERGTLESLDYVDVVCRLRSQDVKEPAATIKWVIEEGTVVKKGDRIIEFDDTVLREQLARQKSKVEQARAMLSQAEDALAGLRKELQIETRLGEIAIRQATLELKKRSSAAAEVREFLELDVEKAKLLLERTTLQFRSRSAQVEAEVATRRARVKHESDGVNAFEGELARCTMTAPRDGVLVYYAPEPSRLRGSLIAQGEPVREGQKLLRITGLTSFAVQTRIHEAIISRLRRGQAATIRVDAYPQRAFTGQVHDVATVANQALWRAKDVKAYATQVTIDGNVKGLKPGMSAEVEIVTAQKPDVLLTPATALLGAGTERFCYVKADKEIHKRLVVAGLNTEKVIEIKEGLQAGAQVLRDPAALMRRLAPALEKGAKPRSEPQ